MRSARKSTKRPGEEYHIMLFGLMIAGWAFVALVYVVRMLLEVL